MSTYSPFQRLFVSTASITSTVATVDPTTASDVAATASGLWLSWPELTLNLPFTTAASSDYLQLVTNAVVSLDRNILRCLFSLSTSRRRSLWVVLLSTGLVGSMYASYTFIWPFIKPYMNTCMWDPYMLSSIFHASAPITGKPSDKSDVKQIEETNNATQTRIHEPESPSSPDDDDNMNSDSVASIRPLYNNTLSTALLSNVFQRALNAVRSHQLTTKAALATTVLLERHDHQWFTTLRKYVDSGVAIVGVSVRVPATLCLAPTDEVVTLNRWLEVDIRRAPPSDSPVCLWSNDVGDMSNTNVDSADAHPAESGDVTTPPDGFHLSALLRDVVGHQFKRQHQPLPALQYRVHNQLCAPEHATRYGLEVATIVAGVVSGCALAATATESSLATHTSLASWATDIGPRCKHEWTVYKDAQLPSLVSSFTENDEGAIDASTQPPTQSIQSPFNIQSRIAAALWESDDDSESDTNEQETDTVLTTVQLSDEEPHTVTSPSYVQQPVVVCGQLVRISDNDDDPSTEWPTDAINSTFVQHLDEVLRPSKTSPPPTIHIDTHGELYVLTYAPIGLTVKQLLVQACEQHGCALQLHCQARVYHMGTAATCKVRQTWISSVELV